MIDVESILLTIFGAFFLRGIAQSAFTKEQIRFLAIVGIVLCFPYIIYCVFTDGGYKPLAIFCCVYASMSIWALDGFASIFDDIKLVKNSDKSEQEES